MRKKYNWNPFMDGQVHTFTLADTGFARHYSAKQSAALAGGYAGYKLTYTPVDDSTFTVLFTRKKG